MELTGLFAEKGEILPVSEVSFGKADKNPAWGIIRRSVQKFPLHLV
jgi:hypothetical protein